MFSRNPKGKTPSVAFEAAICANVYDGSVPYRRLVSNVIVPLKEGNTDLYASRSACVIRYVEFAGMGAGSGTQALSSAEFPPRRKLGPREEPDSSFRVFISAAKEKRGDPPRPPFRNTPGTELTSIEKPTKRCGMGSERSFVTEKWALSKAAALRKNRGARRSIYSRES